MEHKSVSDLIELIPLPSRAQIWVIPNVRKFIISSI